MNFQHAPEYTKILSLVKNPKMVFPVIIADAKKKVAYLMKIKNKNWDNFGSAVVDLFFWSDKATELLNLMKDIDSISDSNANIFDAFVDEWKKEILSVSGFYDSLMGYYKFEKPSNTKEYKIILVLIDEVSELLNMEKSKVFQNRKVRFAQECFWHNTGTLISKVCEIRRQCQEENYFTVDSLALLNTFAKGRVAEAKEVSAKFGLKEKYALLLTEENFDSVMAHCPDRDFRKKVYIKKFEVSTQSKWSCQEEIKEIISMNYQESKAMGFSSVCRQVSSQSGIDFATINQFVAASQVEKFTAYSNWMSVLDNFAKTKLGINVIRAWDKSFVVYSYNQVLMNKSTWGKATFSSNEVWKKTFSLIGKVFKIDVKEISGTKLYVNDKLLGFFKDGKQIGSLYISTESRKAKSPMSFFITTNRPSVWGEDSIPLGVISLQLEAGANFKNLDEIKVLLHEMGHAIQSFLAFTNPKMNSIYSSAMRFDEGLEEMVIEFPSQWFEEYAFTVDFLKGVLNNNRTPMSDEKIKNYVSYWVIGSESDDWENMYYAKIDWLIHRNKVCLDSLDSKVQELKKEFGFYTSKNDKALTDYRHFHMKGRFFSYDFTKSLVKIFNADFAHLTDTQKGDLLSNWYINGVDDGLLCKFDSYIKQPVLLRA